MVAVAWFPAFGTDDRVYGTVWNAFGELLIEILSIAKRRSFE
jgi:hypothetical protein